MTPSADYLRRVADKAAPLDQRWRDTRPTGGPADQERGRARLARWREVVALDDDDRFQRRLAWDGLDAAAVETVLAAEDVPGRAPLPAWTRTLAEMLDAAAAARLGRPPALAPADDTPIAFQEVVRPFADLAIGRVAVDAGAGWRGLTESARQQLARGLLRRLATLAAGPLYLEFSLYRRRRVDPLSLQLATATLASRRELYDRFTVDLLAGLPAFLEEYSVLARLMATTIDDWVAAAADAVRRLATDRRLIEETFFDGSDPGDLAGVTSGLSDLHDGGREVLSLTFTSGARLIYKPRDLGIELGFYAWLRWLNTRDAALDLATPTVLDRTTHGWMQFVAQGPCDDSRQAARYFRRAGALLAVIHALNGGDCHVENVIAHGEYPVLIDAEVVVPHVPRTAAGDGPRRGARDVAADQLRSSVLATALLPVWQTLPGGHAVNVGGYADCGPAPPVPVFAHVNSDAMMPATAPAGPDANENTPTLGGAALPLRSWTAHLVDGFTATHRLIVRHAPALTAEDGPLRHLDRRRARYVFRSTRVYVGLLSHLLQPRYLRDGRDRGIEIEALSRAIVSAPENAPSWRLAAAERDALERGEVPRFTTTTSATGLEVAPGHVLDAFFEETSVDRIRARIASLDDADLERQRTFIRAAVFAGAATVVRGTASPDAAGAATTGGGEAPPFDPIAEARSIAATLDRLAIRGSGHDLAWTGLCCLPGVDRYQVDVVGFELYDGACGIALFLAALHRVTSDVEYADMAERALRPVTNLLRDSDAAARRAWARSAGAGAGTGIGGMVYGLVRAGRLIESDSLMACAADLSRLISSEIIERDSRLDVLNGSAGAILGLLALHAHDRGGDALDRAVRCGHHLLSRRRRADSGYRVWATHHFGTLTGFSHGLAGIAFALMRLYEASGHTDFLEAADEAIAFENTLFSAEARNWPDLRPGARTNGESGFVCAWCHGAPGIGLARLGGLRIADTPQARADIEHAIAATQRVSAQGVDHLCCGSLGRAEFLWTAGLRLGRPDLMSAARRLTAQVLQRARVRGAFDLSGTGDDSVDRCLPGLFQGVAGIGYFLLRLYDPQVPCVLLLE